MEQTPANDVGDILAEISENLGMAQVVDCEQEGFNEDVGGNVEKSVKIETDDELTRIFDSGAESNGMKGALFEALLPPLSHIPDISNNTLYDSNAIQQRRDVAASVAQLGEGASKVKVVPGLLELKPQQVRTVIGSDDKGKSERMEKDEAKVTKPKHVCHVCSKVFKRAHNLKIHGRLHSGAKPYSCPFAGCNKEFRWKSSIVSHMNWHRTKRGDILPGEPDDTSLQTAALRQGTTRRGSGDKRKNKGKNRGGGGVDNGGRNLHLMISEVGGASSKLTDGENAKRTNGTEKEFGNVNMRVVEQEDAVSGIVNGMKEEDVMGRMVQELEGYEMRVELDDLVVEMTGLRDTYVNGEEYGRGEDKMFDGVMENDESFTPSTTATSYDKSPPRMEFEDVVPINLVGVMDDGESRDEDGLLTSSELVCCDFEKSVDPLHGLLSEN